MSRNKIYSTVLAGTLFLTWLFVLYPLGSKTFDAHQRFNAIVQQTQLSHQRFFSILQRHYQKQQEMRTFIHTYADTEHSTVINSGSITEIQFFNDGHIHHWQSAIDRFRQLPDASLSRLLVDTLEQKSSLFITTDL